MKHILIVMMLAAAIFMAACTPSHMKYKESPVKRQEVVDRIGQPDKIIQTKDGHEKLLYAYKGFGVIYVYYLVEDGMVVEDGLQRL
jgi:hypothetical protein